MTAQEHSSAVPADHIPYPYTKLNLDNIKRLYYKIWMLLMNDVQLDLQHHWTYRNWYSSHRESAFFFLFTLFLILLSCSRDISLQLYVTEWKYRWVCCPAEILVFYSSAQNWMTPKVRLSGKTLYFNNITSWKSFNFISLSSLAEQAWKSKTIL